ncbi:hypothetical protein AAG747_07765 [Rapidithrix thailandica]|uniref:Uncharacterized protein n=1 Tax=Rapidithrix thailandica TaxID=413964 RepID=A0AAW9S5V6_9BACT
MFKVSESGNPGNFILVKPLQLAQSPYIVSFYRSQIQAKNSLNSGEYDTAYTGTFGFDRFDASIMSSGLVKEYTKLNGIETHKPSVKSEKDHSYYCPYLSLWPPNIAGVNSANIYIGLEKSNYFDKGNDKTEVLVDFESEDGQVITVNGKAKASVKLVLDDKPGNLPALKLECIGEFEKELAITAKVGKVVIGKLLLYPNKVRYKGVIQPVYVRLGNATSDQLTEVPTATIADIDEQGLLTCANQHGLNQAFIQCEVAQKTHQITFDREELRMYLDVNSEDSKIYLHKKDGLRQDFNQKVKDLYKTVVAGGVVAEERVAKDSAFHSSGIHQILKDFAEKLEKKFEVFKDVTYNANNPNSKYSFNDTYKGYHKKVMNRFWTHKSVNNGRRGLYDKFEQAEMRMEHELAQQGIVNNQAKHGEVDSFKEKTLYVFYFPDIEASYPKTTTTELKYGAVPGYTQTGRGISYIFKSGFGLPDAIVHEIGHGLGLPHPFEHNKSFDKSIRSKQLIDSEISMFNNDISFHKKMQSLGEQTLSDIEKCKLTSYQEYQRYKYFENAYNKVVAELDKVKKNSYDAYVDFRELVVKIRELAAKENGNIPVEVEDVTTTLEEKKQGIKDDIEAKDKKNEKLEKNIEELKVERKTAPDGKAIDTYHPQSDTMENFMDYDFDDSGKKDKFKRKTFYKWQWDKIRETGSGNNLLIELK